MSQSAIDTTQDTVIYPDSDGQPMGETGLHVRAMLMLYAMIQDHMASLARADYYIAADMFLYYERGNPKAVKAPDLMVILGVPNHERRSFKLWEEGAAPSVIVEITSESTKSEDQVGKRELYARLGVAEYFLFDPLDEYLRPRLQGYRLDGDDYARIAPLADKSFPSRELDARLRSEGAMLRLLEPIEGRPYLTPAEKTIRIAEEVRLKDEARAHAEREMRRAERETARAEGEAARARDEARLKDMERARAESEAARADELAAEVARLRALLEGKAEGG